MLAVDTMPQCEIDLREGVSHDAISQDEEKMKEINEKLRKFFLNGIMHKIHS